MGFSVKQNGENTILFGLLAIGTWLRFYRLGDIEFNIDQIYPIWQALNTLDKGTFPLAGQGTSVLFANPTMTGYLFLPFIALARIPLMAYLVTLTLNSFAIWLVYRGVQRLIGIRAALVATALFACNPWIIEDSRRTWVQSFLPFFVCLIFWALAPVLIQQTRRPERRLLIALVGMTIFVNTYLLAYFITAPVGFLLVIFWKRLPRKSLLLGLVIFSLFFGLYMIGLLQEWEQTKQKAEGFFTGGAQLTDEALSHAIRLVTGWEYAAARGINASAHDATRRNDISNVVHVVILAFLAIGVAKSIWNLRNSKREASLILLIWFLFPILLMSYVTRQVHPFYLMFTVPAGHALVASAVSPLLNQRGGQWVVIVGLAITGTINGLNSMRFAQETAAHPGEHIPYTLPLAEATALGRTIHEARQEGMVVYTSMDEWTPMVLAGHIFPVVVVQDVQHMIVIPRGGGLYTQFHASNEPLTPLLHGTIVGLPLRFDDGTRVSLWTTYQNFVPRQTAAIPSDIGVQFIGWHLLEPLRVGKTSHLRTYWQVDSLASDRFTWNFRPYAHVFDGNGERFAIVDGVLLPSNTWQVGDWMIQEMTLEIPRDSVGPFRIHIGLFDGVQMRNAIFNEGAVFTADIPVE